MFRIRQTATNYLQFIDFSAYREELLIAARDGNIDYIRQVINKETGDSWTMEEAKRFSLAKSTVFRYGPNKPEYFTHSEYGEVVTITIDLEHHKFAGYMNLQMSLKSNPTPRPMAEVFAEVDAKRAAADKAEDAKEKTTEAQTEPEAKEPAAKVETPKAK